MTKNKIVLISLAVALVALVVVYFLVVAPLLNDEVICMVTSTQFTMGLPIPLAQDSVHGEIGRAHV